MTEEQLDCYVAGYWDARSIAIRDLKKVLSMRSGQKAYLKRRIAELESDEHREAWEDFQKDFPGTTLEEFEELMTETPIHTRKKHVNKKVYPNLRIIKS